MCPDTSRTENTICAFPNCQRSVWKDPDGSFSAYCGKGHRDAMAAQNVSGANILCKNCHARPVYNQDGRLHDFCGIRCARAFQRQGNQPASTPTAPAIQETPKPCKLDGCNRPVWVDPSGEKSEYCSNRHRKAAVIQGVVEACLNCKEMPKITVMRKGSDFCSVTCKQEAISSAPAIFDLAIDDDQFASVSSQFLDSWKHPGDAPSVAKIWKIYSEKPISDAFERYKLSIERKSGTDHGNTRRRWHGTVRMCNLGDSEGGVLFCDENGCSLCRIIQSSFQLAMAGQRTNFGRFGRGIYTSATSSKAYSYIGQVNQSPYQAMLLNDVVMGKTIKLTVGDDSLIVPPDGYDSVVGEPGNDLNYDESIVYRNDAIRPAYLIIFKKPNSTTNIQLATPVPSPAVTIRNN